MKSLLDTSRDHPRDAKDDGAELTTEKDDEKQHYRHADERIVFELAPEILICLGEPWREKLREDL